MVAVGAMACLVASFGFRSRRSQLLLLYNAILLALLAVAFFMFGFSSVQNSVLRSLTKVCADELGFPLPWFAVPRYAESEIPKIARVVAFAVPIGITVILLVGRVLEELLMRFLKFLSRRSRYATEHLGLRIPHVRNAYRIIQALCSWMLFVALLFMKLQEQREKLTTALAGEDEDSAWGFGQVVAVLAWAPLMNDIFLEIIGKGSVLILESR